MKPRLLDLFCGAGGASMGYSRAGFDVTGVDCQFFKRYPFDFRRGDALQALDSLIAEFERGRDHGFVAVHASPPCQAFTNAQKVRGYDHPDLVGPTRERLERLGLPYVIENVPGAPLKDPIMLCGAMFPGLKTYRHRLFECSFPIQAPAHPPHVKKQVKMGRPVTEDDFVQVVGHFSGVEVARKAMGIDWMTRNELKEAIPPAYTHWIGDALMEVVQS